MIETQSVAVRARTVNARPNELRSLWALTKYPFLAMMRNVSTVAFGFAFPLVFIAVFGLIGEGNANMRLGVTPTSSQQGPLRTIAEMPGITLVEGTVPELERKLRLGKLEGILDVTGSRVVLTLNEANPQSQIARLWVQAVLDRLNLQAVGATNLPFVMDTTAMTGRRDRYIDFALPGQIGFALLSTAIFGTVFGLLYLKKSLILKRLFATPVHGVTILLGQGIARLGVALLQVIVILGVGVLVFGFQLPEGMRTFIEMCLLSVLGLFVFLGFGLFIAGRTNDENAASPITNLFTLPQFLLSGVFFPTDVFPAWLRTMADLLPLTMFNSALRQLAAEGGSLTEIVPPVIGLVVWGIIAYAAASRTFKWV